MDQCHVFKLPNELLLHILTPLPTPELLPLTVICHRIYTLILRILQNRLVAASNLDSHSLLLECYHPSAKLTEPPYFCAYRGTDGLSAYTAGIHDKKSDDASRLGEMKNLYSRFRPHRRELDPTGRRVVRRQRPHPAGDIPGSRTYDASQSSSSQSSKVIPGTASDLNEGGETVKQTLSLEAHELFTQLVAQTNLVKISEASGIFSCFVDVEEGVVRVWREWLKKASSVLPPMSTDTSTNGSSTRRPVQLDENILWVSPSRNSGIRFNVRERKLLHSHIPILIRADEPDADLPVSYELEFSELLIRTSHLLLTLEKSMVQEDNTSGKAIVFGSFG
ncbi:hypothetical protein BU24DRAFT_439597 [Aaosphaeria arxii CBS 175.79]|uniref:F-box domain-containing protein n=1 Tax=Aaosphaeria arxii CBS 175.79 TaxID=1450172 RepID=A0A6A5Y379_9PLEO|nr:uncharacterized protein BU24DRAFT_439597 [Aaosphaeria arxii CBS 175.79]KAF2019477.1 hypothetical protein BU24DRAFT_439597 [Aaosphaeria arxii CBS 175.79]